MSAFPKFLSHPKYRPDIDGLRALAVLSVVIFHAFPAYLKGGFTGVDVFFVISGFLISTIIFENLGKGTFSFSEFYARRIKRIFPALILVLMASYTFGWFALLADEYKQLGKHIAAGAGFISNFVLWQEVAYFDDLAETKPLLHLWSLGIEEQFYIVWPLLVWCAWKTRFNPLVLILSAILISFTLNTTEIHQDSVSAFYSPQTRFWELLCGSLLAWLALYKKNFFPQNTSAKIQKILVNSLSFFGILLLAYSFFRINKNLSFPGKWALIPVLGTLLIIASSQAWINKKILSQKIIVWFGLISFPLYLWHWPLLSFARIIESDTPSRGIRITAVLLSIVLAWLTYRFIERPARFNKEKGHLKVYGLLFLMSVIGFVGYATYQQDGFAFRSHIKNFKNNQNELLRTPAKDEQCLAYLKTKSTKFDYCRFSDARSNETIAVIGDSHAHVAFPGIAAFNLSHHINTVLLANSGCPPYIGVPTGKTTQEKLSCQEKVDELLETLIARHDIKKVFIFTRGPIYWTGTEPLTKNKDVLGYTITIAEFFKGAQKTIDYIARSKKQVYFVTENPELNIAPQACIPRPLRSTPKNCNPPKSDVMLRFHEYLDRTKYLENTFVINSLKSFCPDEKCIVFDKSGTLLYADDDHLSVSGSDFQAKNVLHDFLK